MKGTLNARLENAEEEILNDPKEKYEHTTIVDLIRNDLSKICEKVWVERFRYIDKIRRTSGEELLQDEFRGLRTTAQRLEKQYW